MQVTIGAKCWDGTRRSTLLSTTAVKRCENDLSVKPALTTVPNAGWTKAGVWTNVAALGIGALILPHIVPILAGHAFAAGAAVAVPAMASASSSNVSDKILHAFDPLIHMITTLSYPIAGVMIAAGCLFIMVGSRDRGMDMLKNAALGYILVQLSPMLLQLLVGIGSGV